MGEEKKFYQMSMSERRAEIQNESGLSDAELDDLCGNPGLSEETANHMIENVIGRYSLPIGIARNFLINGRDYLIPMVIEEASVVAAASNGARIVKSCEGFRAEADASCMIGQVQVLHLNDLNKAKTAISNRKEDILTVAAQTCPNLLKRGGGPMDLEIREFPNTSVGPMLVVHLLMNVCDVMGANLIDTALEAIAPEIEKISGGSVRLRILSNLADRRLARAACEIPSSALSFKEYDGETVENRILENSFYEIFC